MYEATAVHVDGSNANGVGRVAVRRDDVDDGGEDDDDAFGDPDVFGDSWYRHDKLASTHARMSDDIRAAMRLGGEDEDGRRQADRKCNSTDSFRVRTWVFRVESDVFRLQVSLELNHLVTNAYLCNYQMVPNMDLPTPCLVLKNMFDPTTYGCLLLKEDITLW